MSGGHFQYQQYRIEDIAVEIDEMIGSNDDQSLDEWGQRRGNNYPPEILEKFREAAHTLRQAAEMAHRVDWLVSGDDGEESFLSRWQTEVRKSWDATLEYNAGLDTAYRLAQEVVGSTMEGETLLCGIQSSKKF